MKKIVVLFNILFVLLEIMHCSKAYSQTTQKSPVQASATGVMRTSNYTLLVTLGQPTPPGQVNSAQHTLFSGHIYTLESAIKDTDGPKIVHVAVTTAESGTDILITAAITDATDINNASLYYRSGGDRSFTSIQMANGDDYQATIPGSSVNSRGVDYYLVASDIAGNITLLPSAGYFSIQVTVPAPGIATTQPAGNAQSAYRIFSVPLVLDNKRASAVLEDDLGAYRNTEWRLFELRSDQAYHEFPDISDMIPGKAFWLIVKNGGTIETGAGRSIATSEPYQITLHKDWNLVANPFNFAIPVSNCVLVGGQAVELRQYDGTWNDPITDPVKGIKPFKGYALKVAAAAELGINPDLSTGTSSFGKELLATTDEELLWHIHILARCDNAMDLDNYAGVGANALTRWDRYDYPEPPVIGDYVSVYFPHLDWEENRGVYCTDFRPESNGDTWEFQVKSNIHSAVALDFADLETVPMEQEIWLVDEELKIGQNLRKSNRYTILLQNEAIPKQLKILVGTNDFVNEQLETISTIPVSYELMQNFPNPFNPTTAIQFGLPDEGKVTLTVFNLLGEWVTTLVANEKLAAGYHVAIWDGRNHRGQQVASGIYVYQLRVDRHSVTRKMVLMK